MIKEKTIDTSAELTINSAELLLIEAKIAQKEIALRPIVAELLEKERLKKKAEADYNLHYRNYLAEMSELTNLKTQREALITNK